MRTRPFPLRTSFATAAIACALVLSALAPAGALVSRYASPAAAAAGWLASTYADTGAALGAAGLVEVTFGLAATADRSVAPEQLVADLSTTAAAYVGAPGSLDPGRAGKVIAAVMTAGGSPRSVGGRDLESELRATMLPTGRFGTASPFGQAVAVLGLARTRGGVPAAAGEYLASIQCADGNYSFVAANAGSCSSIDADVTALAATALRSAGRTTDAKEAVDALVRQQASDGGFGSGSNANSTGLAALALREAAEAAAADRAGDRLVTLQKTAGPNAGAIAYTPTADGSLLMATGQGVLGWGDSSYANLMLPAVAEDLPAAPVITAPAAGQLTRRSITIAGTSPAGSLVTVRDGATVLGRADAADATWELAVTLPDGDHTISATAEDELGRVSPAASPVAFVTDGVAPRVVMVTPDQYDVGVGQTIHATGTATDNRTIAGLRLIVIDPTGRRVRAVDAICDGCGSQSATWVATVTVPTGAYRAQVVVFDAAGNASSAQVQVVRI